VSRDGLNHKYRDGAGTRTACSDGPLRHTFAFSASFAIRALPGIDNFIKTSMTDFSSNIPNFASLRSRTQVGLTFLICCHIVICCVSLIFVAEFYAYLQIIMFDKTRFFLAAPIVAGFAVVSLLFTFGRFSFGYFLGFYFYTLVLGYLWLAEFSGFHYDHTVASISAAISALAFLVPALFVTSPIKQRFVLSARALDILLSIILILAAAIIVIGAFYNFRLVGIGDIYKFRGGIEFPAWLRYPMGATSSALLPFAFACFVARGDRWRAAVVLLLLLLSYPITLNKIALFAPFWLVFLTLLSRFFEARTAVVLSLLLPELVGVILVLLFNSDLLSYQQMIYYFSTINFRMIAFPSIVLDVYNDFFSRHDHTYFCQILFLKPFVICPYSDPLSVMMAKAYQLGNLNASLFGTEGTASVGPILAPLAMLASGLVISLANRVSSGLPSKFILLSGGILPQVFLNVPLTTTLLTGGAALLFLLWYVTPRTMFEPSTDKELAN
jgi:hypothetical protein